MIRQLRHRRTDPFLWPTPRTQPTGEDIFGKGPLIHLDNTLILYPTGAATHDVVPAAIIAPTCGKQRIYLCREVDLDGTASLFADHAGAHMINATENLLTAIRARDANATAVIAIFDVDVSPPTPEDAFTLLGANHATHMPGEHAVYDTAGWKLTPRTFEQHLADPDLWALRPHLSVDDVTEHIPMFATLAAEHRRGQSALAEHHQIAFAAISQFLDRPTARSAP